MTSFSPSPFTSYANICAAPPGANGNGWNIQTGSFSSEGGCSHQPSFSSKSMRPSPLTSPTPKPWKFHPITPNGKWGKFTHGLGVGDVNGDGLNDVITCLNPHGYGLVWWEQSRAGTNITFKQHIIMAQTETGSRFGVPFCQPHSMALVDVNGDGLLDIVTGMRFWAHGRNGLDPESNDFPAVLYWFQLVRHTNGHADFVPHLIDDDSGVGTQVVAGNIVNQKFPDIVVGNKKGTFLFKHEIQP